MFLTAQGGENAAEEGATVAFRVMLRKGGRDSKTRAIQVTGHGRFYNAEFGPGESNKQPCLPSKHGLVSERQCVMGFPLT